MKNLELVTINKEVWIPEIKNRIESWEEFSESVFCEKADDKRRAKDTANRFRAILTAVENDTLTREQFETLVYCL